MKMTDKIIVQLHEFVQTIAEGQYRPNQKFFYEMLFGTIAAGSIVLAEVAQTIEPDKELIQVEKRLRRNWASPRLEEAGLQEAYLDWIAEQVREDTVVAYDLGDIQKKYAKKMEYLAQVWDGSEKEKGPGYWLMEAEGYQKDGQRFGIWFDGWSQAEPDFVSRNKVIMAVVEQVVQATDRRGVSVFDRGFDGEELMKPIDDLEIAFIIRQCGDRLVQRVAGGRRKRPKSVRAIADDVQLRYVMTVWHQNKQTGRWERKRIRYGFCQIYWSVTDKVYTLVVVVGWGKDPLMLWTNLPVRGEGSARYVVQTFSRRWSVEDSSRVIKQEFKLEKVRVESWVSIRRSIILAGLAYDFLCHIGRMGKALVDFITEQVRAFRPLHKVWAYRIRQGLAKLWKDGLRFRLADFG